MGAKEDILQRTRAALSDVHEHDADTDVPIDWVFGNPVQLDGDVVDVFVDRLVDYDAIVAQCGPDQIASTVAKGLQETGATTVVVPEGLDDAWLAEVDHDKVRRADQTPLTPYELNDIDAVVTAAAVAIAQTGTIILDHGPDQGRRALTLVPDRHVCVLRKDQIVSGVPEAVARLHDSVQQKRPQTWISGPSATSDIELDRVQGVHGPRHLYVIIVG